MAPALPTHRRRRTRRQGQQKHDIQPHCTKRAKQRDSSKNPCPRIRAPGPLHTPAPDMQRLGNGEGRVRGPGPRARGAYRRRGQAGPPDSFGAGVQRRVLVLREGGMHGKVRLLAVHGHHLDGLACKSTNTPKVRGKVRTPAPPASLPRLQPRRLAARRRRLRWGAAALLLPPLPPGARFDRAERRAPASRSHFSKSSSPARGRDALLLHLSPTSRGRPGELSRELAAQPR